MTKNIVFPSGIPVVEISTLTRYENNARTHSDYQIEKLVASIKTFGFTNPIIIDEDSVIIAGHGRLEAAIKLGLTEVPAITLSHLTKTEKKALILADNRIAEDAGWDMELVKTELSAINTTWFDISLTGFSLEDLNIDNDFDPGDEEDQGDIGKLESVVTCPNCEHRFKPKYD